MKAVLHLPVAEQYPSKTAMVSDFASKRTSGMSGSFLSGVLFVKGLNGLAVLVSNRFLFPGIEAAYDWLRNARSGLNLLLRLAGLNECGDHLFKHGNILYAFVL